MRVLVAGASGAIGRPWCVACAKRHEVFAMRSSNAALLQEMGAEPIRADALAAAMVRAAVRTAPRPQAARVLQGAAWRQSQSWKACSREEVSVTSAGRH